MKKIEKNTFQIPIWSLAALAGILIALVAIFVYKVPSSLVLSYGLIAVMLLSHIFMHSGHSTHGDHQEQDKHSNLQKPSVEFHTVPDKKAEENKHNQGCH